MLALDDPAWATLEGGYRLPYDPRPALRQLEASSKWDDAWEELWNELHHQGDVGEASYAAVPHIVRIYTSRGIPDWNAYALVGIIEEARRADDNPELCSPLRAPYEDALRQLAELGLRELAATNDPNLINSIIAVVAFWKGQATLGRMAFFTEDERVEILANGMRHSAG
jgi:hypothetical protein